jgi:thioredoxin 1
VKLSPVIDSIAGQFAGRVKVGKVNVHENFELANEYNIQSIPRILLFKGGKKPLRQMAGLVSEAELSRVLKEVMG